MKLIKKAVLPLTLSLGLFSNVAMAEAPFAGYVATLVTGPYGGSTFNSALVGMSFTDGGAVEQYVFTSDSDYLNMIVAAYNNNEHILVTHDSGALLGIQY